MAEKDSVFSSKIKYDGVFSFKSFYKFCYDWLTEESQLSIEEPKYVEKVKGDSKEIEVEWKGSKKFTDYFKFDAKIKFKIIGLKKVEINQGGKKTETNKGNVEISMKGTLVRDYQGKFEQNATQKMWRSIYEKWIIPSRIKEYEDKIVGTCDEFLSQAKAYLDLEGKK
ncbi:MAG TPA: hypothetical protein VJ912_04480 [Candidatus Nanoarchaeia archaeon]|nr:hypothetical protein [Candidatus Nanoarchaeia archaeon]